MWQTLSVFEISHAVFNLSPGASVTAVCITFAERMLLLVACLLPFYELRTNAHVTAPFLAWSTTNTVRFACVPPPTLKCSRRSSSALPASYLSRAFSPRSPRV